MSDILNKYTCILDSGQCRNMKWALHIVNAWMTKNTEWMYVDWSSIYKYWSFGRFLYVHEPWVS
jgi:hypothetical protein